MSEPALVILARHGDERAFRDLVEPYRVKVQHRVAAILKDETAAQDIWQDTLIRVYRNLKHFDTTKRFQTWIYTIATNCALNELRNRKRRSRVMVAIGDMADDDGNEDRVLGVEDTRIRPDRMFESREIAAKIEQAVNALPSHQAEVFLLRETAGQSYEEIALAIGRTIGTVKSRLHRARTALATALTEVAA